MSALFPRNFLWSLRAARRPSVSHSAVLRPSPCHSRVYTVAADGRTAGRMIRASYVLGGAILLGTTSYLVGVMSPPTIFQLINPRPAPPPPSAQSAEGRLHTERIERELQNLEIVKRCRESDDADEWYETRPYAQMPHERLVNHLTAGALRGPGKIAVPPLVRAKKDETEAWVFMHLGRAVCGHDGIVHGGLLATLLDEGCGRNAVLNIPSHVVVTANLNLDYKAPARADQFVVMKTRLVELKGRKAVVEGRIEDLDGNVLAQARILYVEPKVAKALNVAVIQDLFPSVKSKVTTMTGANDRGGQAADDGSVKGQ